jgi:hypothetical protein
MKIRNMKLLIIFLLLLPLCMAILGAGCEKDEQECSTVAVNGNKDDIAGKWKLIKGEEVYYNPRTVNYSCNNVIYHFQSDDILIITSDIGDIIGFEHGQYSYEFSLTENKENYTLKIGHLQGGCVISSTNLNINYSSLDGPILNFVRIQ